MHEHIHTHIHTYTHTHTHTHTHRHTHTYMHTYTMDKYYMSLGQAWREAALGTHMCLVSEFACITV